MTEIIISGACGRMGRMIVQGVAAAEDLTLVGAVDAANHPLQGQDVGEIAGVGKLDVPVQNGDALADILTLNSVLIEFSVPEATLAHLRLAAKVGAPMVIATTGYSDAELQEFQNLTEQIRCVVAPNMSIGVNVLLRLIRQAAIALGDAYDVEVIEAHHNQKTDSPSGTALRIAEVLADALERDLGEVGLYGRHGIVGKRTAKEIGVHAVRGGDIVGDHTILFAGTGERIEITHRAHSRETFTQGALRAARWVVSASKGRHDIAEVLFD